MHLSLTRRCGRAKQPRMSKEERNETWEWDVILQAKGYREVQYAIQPKLLALRKLLYKEFSETISPTTLQVSEHRQVGA